VGGVKNEEKTPKNRTLRNSLVEGKLIGDRGVDTHN